MKKNILIVDIWTFVVVLLLGFPGYLFLSRLFLSILLKSPHESPIIKDLIPDLVGYSAVIALLSSVFYILFCSRLKKWRYLVTYTSCSKIPDFYKAFVLGLLMMVAIIILIMNTYIFLFILPFAIIMLLTCCYFDENMLKYIDGEE